jgi:tetratricopeptide (TPR) repeat protein
MLRAAASCAAILVVASACGWSEDPAGSIRRAQQALADGDLAGARAELRVLGESAPESGDELLALAELLLRANEAPRALWLLEAGVERFPERDDLKVALARAALVVGNAVRARAAVAAISPQSAEHLQALLIRAHAQLALGDLEAALATLATAERLYPDSSEARAARIGTLLSERRLDEAAQVIETVRGSATGDEAISLSLLAARVEAARGDPAAAVTRLSEAHDRHPDNVAVLDALVTAQLQLERAQAAVELVDAAIERDPEQAALHAIAARAHLRGGAFELAEQSLRRYAELSHLPVGYVPLAQFYLDRGRPEDAAAANAAAVDRFPDETAPRVWLTESLIDRGDLDRARGELRALSRLAADDPQLAYLRARLDLAAGDAEAAAEQLRGLVSVLDRAHTQYWLGRALEARGDIDGAERRYGLALLRDGAHAAGAAELMRLAERRGDWSKLAQHALALVRRAPAKDDGYPTAITALARTGQTAAAEALAREYVRRFADRAVAYALLAFALRAQGRLDEAVSELEAAAELFGDAPELLAERGALMAAQGRIEEGIRSLESAIERAPSEARHHALLAALLLARGQREAGEAAVERALTLDPGDLTPLELRSRYRAATGNLTGALEDCQRYLALRPRNAGVRFTCGVVLEQFGETERAIEAYRLAIAGDERAFAARNNLALLLAAKGDLEGGLEVAQQAYGLAESNPEVIDTLGRLYRESGLPKRAVALLEKARAAGIDRPSSRYQLALAYAELGRVAEARVLLRELAEASDATGEFGSRARVELDLLATQSAAVERDRTE